MAAVLAIRNRSLVSTGMPRKMNGAKQGQSGHDFWNVMKLGFSGQKARSFSCGNTTW